MNEWEWIYQIHKKLLEHGQDRLAYLIEKISDYTVNNEHAQVDAIIPEALALTHQCKIPWLEVYFRYWHLESRIWKRFEGRNALADAINLVEFAHREENKECPWTVSTLYSLIGCHGIIDGPGFAEERKKIALEALSHLNPAQNTNIFDCFTGEYAGALFDQEKYAEAYAFLMKQDALRIKSSVPLEESPNLWQHTIRNLSALKRNEEALEQTQQFQEKAQHDRSRFMRLQLYKTSILAHLQRWEEAEAALPPLSEIEPNPGYYKLWTEAVKLLIQGNILPNTWQLAKTLQQFIHRLSTQGAIRPAIDIAFIQIELAFLRKGSLFVVQKTLSTLQSLVPLLHQSLDVPHKIELLEQQVLIRSSLPPIELPNPPQAGIDIANQDPEETWVWLEQALVKWPDNEGLVLAGSCTLRNLGEQKQAQQILENFAQNHPISENFAIEFGRVLLESNEKQALFQFCDKLIQHPEPHLQSRGYYLQAMRYHLDEEWEKSTHALKQALQRKPQAKNFYRLLIRNALNLQDWELTLHMVDQLIDLEPEDRDLDWLRIEVGTRLRKWDLVRASCARVNLPLSNTEGPIEENWEMCQIQFSAEPSTPVYYAQRTGPVTARLLEVAPPHRTQHFRDEVIFSAKPLNEPPTPEDNEYIFLYKAIDVLKNQNMIGFDLDGVHPGEEILQKLEETFSQLGGCLQVRSTEEYQVSYQEQTLPGIYAYGAVPNHLELYQIHQMIEEHLAASRHPLVYLHLAKQIADPALIKRHQELIKLYNLASYPTE